MAGVLGLKSGGRWSRSAKENGEIVSAKGTHVILTDMGFRAPFYMDKGQEGKCNTVKNLVKNDPWVPVHVVNGPRDWAW